MFGKITNSLKRYTFNSARAFVAQGSWLCVEGTKYVCRQGLLRIDLLLTVVGVEKRGRIFSWNSFNSGHHVTPRGCWYSVKLDHQFLNTFLHFCSFHTFWVCIFVNESVVTDLTNVPSFVRKRHWVVLNIVSYPMRQKKFSVGFFTVSRLIRGITLRNNSWVTLFGPLTYLLRKYLPVWSIFLLF